MCNLFIVTLAALLCAPVYTTHDVTNQLSFSGGGAFGAVEIGIIKKIRESYAVPYERYTGISAGGLNAGFLSHYADLDEGIKSAEQLYSSMRNRDVFELLPETGNSILNTHPLHNTLTRVISNMSSEPIIHTLIGTVNLYTGNLDIYPYHENTLENQVLLMMSTSAIPIVFPPIKYNNYMYADGGTLSNELLDIVHTDKFLNITYITPYGLMEENDTPIHSIKDMVMRTFQIVSKNFNNPFVRLNHECETPYGEIHYYYVDSSALDGYNMLNFDKGAKLVEIGYNNVSHKKYKLC
jgi:predicted patatin/cPLA2 family phospholipase